MGNPVKFEHYASYPVCGFCQTAWDIIFQRRRGHTNPEQWVGYCAHHGCDPDIWDYINRTTGWPKGFKVSRKTGQPNWKKLPELPELDDRVYHKRETDGPYAKWRSTSKKLTGEAMAAREAFRMEDPADRAEWDDDEEEEVEPVDLADADIW